MQREMVIPLARRLRRSPRLHNYNPIGSAALIDDLFFEIWLGLPMRSLLRFRSVSKTWRSGIDDPHFHQLYGSRQRTQIGPLLFVDEGSSSRRYVKSLSLLESPENKPTLLRTLPGACLAINLIPSWRDLVCLVINKDIELWNPSTKVIKILPRTLVAQHRRYYGNEIGFGYLQSTDEYKVFRVYEKNCEIFTLHYDTENHHATSYTSSSWKMVDLTLNNESATSECVYANECMHWLTKNGLFCFDLKTEKSSIYTVEMFHNSYAKSLIAGGGSDLWMSVFNTFGHPCMEMWCFSRCDANGWMKLYKIKLEYSFAEPWARGVHQKHVLITYYMKRGGYRLSSYDLKTGSLNYCKKLSDVGCRHNCEYTEGFTSFS